MQLAETMAGTIAITFPDGSVRSYPMPVTGADIASAISISLGKAALAIRVNGELQDLALPIESDASIQIVTAKVSASCIS